MKTTTHYKGHRWTTAELRDLMKYWQDGVVLADIAEVLNATQSSVLKMVQKLRKSGIPLERRERGNIAGKSYKPWTAGEVEYLIRRRSEKATSVEIAVELQRTGNAVDAMIAKLRKENVPVAMRGQGVRKLWNPDALKGVAMQDPESKTIELEMA